MEASFQKVDIFRRSIEAAAPIAMKSARQQTFFAPPLDRALGDLEPVPKLFDRPKALLQQSRPVVFELVGGA